MNKFVFPQVIFLDAVGTLIGVRQSVGHVYADVARQFGVTLQPAAINRAFRQSFQNSPAAAFPGASLAEIPQLEFQWWLDIARQTFQQAGALGEFSDFERFFQHLYLHFATAAAWVVYDDVYSTLQQWRSEGIRLGILSNFDSRLYAVLRSLDLDAFFSSITISTEVGSAKPDAGIFSAALEQQGCLPDRAWHIGDSYHEDYQGAIAQGLTGIWLCRSDDAVPQRSGSSITTAEPPPLSCIQSLADWPSLLKFA